MLQVPLVQPEVVLWVESFEPYKVLWQFMVPIHQFLWLGLVYGPRRVIGLQVFHSGKVWGGPEGDRAAQAAARATESGLLSEPIEHAS